MCIDICSNNGMEEMSLMKFVKKKSKKWFLKLESMIINNWVRKRKIKFSFLKSNTNTNFETRFGVLDKTWN